MLNVLLIIPYGHYGAAIALSLIHISACYGEVFDEPLADEGRSIIASWSVASLTAEQQEAVDEFQNVVDLSLIHI